MSNGTDSYKLSKYNIRVIVAGTRDYDNLKEFYETISSYMRQFNEPILFISGDASSGADRLIIDYCDRFNIPCVKYPANWDLYKKSAGYIRNSEMAEVATHVLCFWDGVSKGTKHMIDISAKKNLPTEIKLIDMSEAMHPPGPTVEGRSISAFPISIGTSLSLESLFSPRNQPYDPKREIPNKIDLNKYKSCWISLYTMYRNISGACSKEARDKLTPEKIVEVLEQEIDVINSLFLVEGGGICKPYFYICTYQDAFRTYSKKSVVFRTDTTESQKQFAKLFGKAMEIMFKKYNEHYKFDSEIKPTSNDSAIIITHVPYDLLSYRNFSRLDLLESHTGVLKPRYNWSSKYHPVGDHDLSSIPFTKKLLLVFGDRVLLKPSDYKLRTLILDIAKKRNWTSFTTEAKMLQDFELEIKEPFVLEYLRKL